MDGRVWDNKRERSGAGAAEEPRRSGTSLQQPRRRAEEDSNEEPRTLILLPSCPALPHSLPPPSRLGNSATTVAQRETHQSGGIKEQNFCLLVCSEREVWSTDEGARRRRYSRVGRLPAGV